MDQNKLYLLLHRLVEFFNSNPDYEELYKILTSCYEGKVGLGKKQLFILRSLLEASDKDRQHVVGIHYVSLNTNNFTETQLKYNSLELIKDLTIDFFLNTGMTENLFKDLVSYLVDVAYLPDSLKKGARGFSERIKRYYKKKRIKKLLLKENWLTTLILIELVNRLKVK